ncbi:PqqD family peptide modification chaperone [Granulicella mallensis]|jgi:radical SAM protein with 4Fe4S-binding SPASM domain|uniref:Radical SAM protein with 4Fe4S-binding SPASM domain n=1 Tax=Granulicella mallensis TaxID=940614 RepID=A0A7W7ZLR8_9BACT|nr:PqqD family peptide modification chaperone [Granulicella mallensis]MBB5062257.1 radical SAM protein with 4Fe4S-binding SPASM domain [Granulicella mallensis]
MLTQAVTLRDKVGTRQIGAHLCLINQRSQQAWVFSGVSSQLWDELRAGRTPEEIALSLAARVKVPLAKAEAAVQDFLENLWGHGFVTLEERSGEAPASAEEPFNSHGRLWNICFDNHVLFRTWIDLLIPCNLRCQHCYLDFSKTDVMPFADVCSYLDQLAEHGCPEVVLTGGEIFLRRDIMDIIAYTQEKGFLFELFTNGNFITASVADQLAKYHIGAVQISVYGTSAAVHEAITRKPGTFEKSIRAAKLLIERGIPVRLVNVVQAVNYEDAFGFPAFAHSIGADYDIDGTLMPNRNGSQEPLKLGISVAQMAALHTAGVTKPPNPQVQCTAARGKGRITSHGDIYPCNVINNASLGNLRTTSLEDIWASPWRNELRESIVNYKPTRCGSCSNDPDCVPCAATRGFNQEHHEEAPVSEACMITTADLLYRGRAMAPDSPVARVAASMGSDPYAQNAGNLIHGGLVQIQAIAAAR